MACLGKGERSHRGGHVLLLLHRGHIRGGGGWGIGHIALLSSALLGGLYGVRWEGMSLDGVLGG